MFDAEWARTLIEDVMRDLEKEYHEAGKDRLYGELKAFLAGRPGSGGIPLAANALGMEEGAVRVAVHRLRKRYGTLLRETVAGTLTNEEDIDSELRYLIQVVGS